MGMCVFLKSLDRFLLVKLIGLSNNLSNYDRKMVDCIKISD